VVTVDVHKGNFGGGAERETCCFWEGELAGESCEGDVGVAEAMKEDQDVRWFLVSGWRYYRDCNVVREILICGQSSRHDVGVEVTLWS